jgi:D-beta-D-heptose 7-phosphate kinase/D-beta-D-heptose 1-phosphate adenosyltransferase
VAPPIYPTSGPKTLSTSHSIILSFPLPSTFTLSSPLFFLFHFRQNSETSLFDTYHEWIATLSIGKHREICPLLPQLKMNRIKTIAELSSQTSHRKWVVTSGGFDPLHIGHLRCIQESARIARQLWGQLIVIVNGDGFLRRKKGKPFMNHSERMEIVAGLRGVTYVVGWDDGSQTVTGAIEKLQPYIFTKGGDRNERAVVPEFEICEQLGCQVLFGVGGGKIQSSSELLQGIAS